ncbi:AHH domain-containing protein [Salmonella enterica]|nr:AHH domain-containing protein [Salmonella enterica]
MKKFIYILILIFSFTSLPKANAFTWDSTDKMIINSLKFALTAAVFIEVNAHWQNYKKKYPKVNFKEFLQKETPVKSLLADDFRFQMGQVKDEKLYKIYNKIAETLHIPDIPPFMPEDSSKYKPGGMEGHNGNIDNKLENPISDVHYPYILENPETGEKVDTRLEFPMETPKTWEDYLLLKQDSQILGKNMEKAGIERPYRTAGHHIIPVSMPEAEDARNKLWKYGDIGINDAENGVFLPQKGADKNGVSSPAVGLIHSGVHPKVYAKMVSDAIMSVPVDINNKEQSRANLINKLNEIKQKLIDAPANNKDWYNLLDD